MDMKTIILEDFGGIENFKMTEKHLEDPREGEVRIQICAASINPVDFKTRKGLLGGTLPMVLGVDAAGRIDAVGAGVSGYSIGDEIYAFVDPEGPAGNGSYAGYVTLPAAFVGKKPFNYTFPQAAAMAMVGPTAYQCVFDKARVEKDESIFVAGGSGAVGAVAIQLAKYRGANPIITTAGTDESFRYLVEELGVPERHILDYKGLSLEDMKKKITEMNGGKPVRAAFDFVGGDMKRLCFNVIGFDMRVVSIVEEPEDFRLHLLSGAESPLFAKSGTFHFQLLLARARFGQPNDWNIYGEELDALTDLAEAGHVNPHRIIMLNDFSAESVQEGHRRLEGRHVDGKLVLPISA